MRTLLVICFVFFSITVFAQVSVTNTSTVTIDFSATVSGVSNGIYTAAGFQSSPSSGQLDSDSWEVTGWTDGSLSYGGTQTTSSTDYTRGSVSAAQSTGGFYAYTGSPASVSNPIFYIQPVGSDFAPGTLTLRIQNNSGKVITSFQISYNLYVRNDQGRSNLFNFSYSTDNTGYTTVPSLDYTSTATADANGLVLVGSAPSKSTTINGLSISSGSYFYIRWSSADVGGSGNRDEFGLDDIALTPTLNDPPTASNVDFSFGSLEVGQLMTGSYDYSDSDNDLEGTSTFKWYKSDDASGTNETEIGGATSSTYTLQTGDLDKYIAFEVTPVAATGVSNGTAVKSSRFGPITASVPVISVNGSFSYFGTILSGNLSTVQDYTVSGTNLTDDITIQAPTGFEIKKSTDGSYSSTVILTQSGGTVSTTTINVRFSPSSTGDLSGSISHTSSGASTENLSVSGYGVTSPVTYEWNTASGSWTSASNWFPQRTNVASTDILSFNGNTIPTASVSSLPSSETIGKLILSNNAKVTFTTSVASTVTINGGTGTDFDIPSNSKLILLGSGSNSIHLSLATGATGSISDTLRFSGTASSTTHQLLVTDASSITVQNGGSIVCGNNLSGNPFGTTPNNGIIFSNGSKFMQSSGSNPFAATAPNSVVVFQTGSTFIFTGNPNTSFSGRTYTNLTINSSSFSQSPTGAVVLNIDDLTVTQGVLNLNLTGGINIKGNISVANGQTLTINPGSIATTTLNGSSTQTISNSGTFSLGSNANLSVSSTTNLGTSIISGAGTVTVLNGGILQLASTNSGGAIGNQISASGGLILNSGSTVELNGSGTQFLAARTFSNLLISNSNNVSLNGNIIVSGLLNLSAGKIITGANSVTVSNVAADDGSTNGIIRTSGYIDGTLIRTIGTSTGTRLFPIGTSSYYRGFNINLTDALDSQQDMTVAFNATSSGINGLPINDSGYSINALSGDGFWSASLSGSGGTFSFNLDLSGFGFSSINDFSVLRIVRRDNNSSAWGIDASVHSAGTGSNSNPVAHRSGFTTFGEFTIGSDFADNTLPVELMSFKGNVRPNGILLNWETASELNNVGFEILRSENGFDFSPVVSFSTSSALKSHGKNGGVYSYLDDYELIENKTYWYQLVDFSLDGSKKYLQKIKVDVLSGELNRLNQPENFGITSIYPNPFNPETKIKFQLTEPGKYNMKLFTVRGREVETLVPESFGEAKHYEVIFNGRNLASGIYFVVLNQAKNKSISKLVLIK